MQKENPMKIDPAKLLSLKVPSAGNAKVGFETAPAAPAKKASAK